MTQCTYKSESRKIKYLNSIDLVQVPKKLPPPQERYVGVILEHDQNRANECRYQRFQVHRLQGCVLTTVEEDDGEKPTKITSY